MRRGDIVLAVTQEEDGKPRPAVVVQTELFNANHASLLVCLLTSTLIDAPLFRLTVQPSLRNGLREPSQIMVDKLLALPRARLREHIGTLEDKALLALNRSLALMLGLAGV
jgi:mRNA interferase MazF